MATSPIFEKLLLRGPHLKTAQTLPALIYGTAWKREATSELVYQAMSHGFTAVDTAAQPKHYREDLVAAGISRAIKDGKVTRSELYLQTKFTSIQGQDLNDLPYDPKSSVIDQLNASVMSSLRNFDFRNVVKDGDTTEHYIDALVLHSPMSSIHETLEVWRTLEQYVPGEIHHLGISNCNLFTLMELYEKARIKPAVVQNRFYANTKYDIGLRRFCRERGIIYQSFWTLNANPALLEANETQKLMYELGISSEAALYCLVLGLGGTTILNGTTKPKTMLEDWEAIRLAGEYARARPEEWNRLTEGFRKITGEIAG